jgi:chromosome segregation ATPase
MPLFQGRSSLLEVQNRALIKTAKDRAVRIDELERDLQQAKNEVERLTLERDFYSKKASQLEQQNRELTEAATKYSLWGQKLERELARIDPGGAPGRRFDAQHE